MTFGFGGFTPGFRTLNNPLPAMDKNLINRMSKMTDDLGVLLNSKHLADVVFEFNDGPPLYAHKTVLIARSPIFLAMFLNKDTFDEAKEGRVNICDIQSDVFQELLHYVYTTKVPRIGELAFELLIAAEKYDLQELKNMCEKELIKLLTAETMQIYHELAIKHNASELKEKSVKFMTDWAKNKIETMTENPVAFLKMVDFLKYSTENFSLLTIE